MSRFRVPTFLLAATSLVLLAACTAAPLPDPVIDPAGPLDVRVGATVTFEAENIGGVVDWSVDDVQGGTTQTGTIVDGIYQAPTRIPSDSTVTVTASDAVTPTRRASSEVTITAPGTLYVLDDVAYVYGDMDVVDGDVAPDRSFTIAGVTGEMYDMAMAPALDMAFIGVQTASPNVFRVENVSAADGEVTATGFSSLTYLDPAGLAYDHIRDVLYVQVDGALLAHHDASTAPAGSEPNRVVAGPSLDTFFTGDTRLSLDPDSDRLFVSNPNGLVAVYDEVSTTDGEVEPDRLIDLDAPTWYLWGAAYDFSRDELYLGDQEDGVGVYVIANASSADGLVPPARSIGGPTNPFDGPAQLSYDVANDRLVVIDANGNDVKVFDQASTLDGDVPPTRVIGGPLVPITYPYSGYLDPTQ